MENSLFDLLLKICRVLKSNDVEYLIVGGTAVALHGYYRHSTNDAGIVSDKPDLDFWYSPTYDNYFKLLSALEDLGQNVTAFRKEKTPKPRQSFFRYDLEHFKLDFLPTLKADLNFRTVFQRRETVAVDDIPINFIGLDDLLTDKKSLGRPKDIVDVQQLLARKNLGD